MDLSIEQFVGIAGAPFVQALTELVKNTFPRLESRWYPAISVIWGVILNVALAVIIITSIPVAVIMGVATGLLASGLFAWGKRTEVINRR